MWSMKTFTEVTGFCPKAWSSHPQWEQNFLGDHLSPVARQPCVPHEMHPLWPQWYTGWEKDITSLKQMLHFMMETEKPEPAGAGLTRALWRIIRVSLENWVYSVFNQPQAEEMASFQLTRARSQKQDRWPIGLITVSILSWFEGTPVLIKRESATQLALTISQFNSPYAC